MESVTTTTSAARTATGQSTEGASGTLINSDFQTFLVMLTTQMKNQDPLNPIDSSDYAQQLATFSGVEQQVRTNDLLASMSSQMSLSGMGQMASWVGMEARVTAPVAFDGTPITLYPAPDGGADQMVVVAYDANGREVTRNALPASATPVAWGGTDATGLPLAAGAYSFRLESYFNGEKIGESPVETYGRIFEVRNGASGVELVLEGGATVAPTDIGALRAAAG